ncbi:MAG: prepilin-type N-terminal cleavage/methylation domain-containing protein [Opitutales bacterium]|nr:prepilin-type N-terminal cleavage/methylation domain-containing protein [Opitutales bacterium]
MKNRNSKKGFTLVEIMIVVVIIGLLAAMAIPAFQKVRENSIRGTMRNDARQLASAAQQYMLEQGTTQVTVTVANTNTGDVSGALSDYVARIARGITVPGTIDLDDNFTLGHDQGGTLEFTPEGQPTGVITAP